MTALEAAQVAMEDADEPYTTDYALIRSLRRAVRALVDCAEAQDERIAALEAEIGGHA